MAIIDNLEAYYKLDDNDTNTTVDDAHTNNYDGTASAFTSTLDNGDAVLISAFDLQGTASWLVDDNTLDDTIGNAAASTGVTVVGWIKSNNADWSTAGRQVIFRFQTTANNEFYLEYLNTSNLLRAIFVENTDVNIVNDDSGTVDDTNYHQVGIVIDTPNSLLRMYIDGSEVGTAQAIDGDFVKGNSLFGFGYNIAATNRYWDGLMDEWAVFSEAKSASDMSNLYNSGAGLAYPFSTNVTVITTAQALTLAEQDPLSLVTVIPTAQALTLAEQDPAIESDKKTAQSTSIDYNNGTITTAKLTTTFSSGSADEIKMTADGTNWETVTSGVAYTFLNPGTDLRWRIKGSAAAVLTQVDVEDYH